MTEIMCMLANDHRNMTKIIDALQRQISSLDHEGALELGPIRNILGGFKFRSEHHLCSGSGRGGCRGNDGS